MGLYVSEHPVAVPSPQEEIKDAAESIGRSAERRQASSRIASERRDTTRSTGRPPLVSSESWQRISVAAPSLVRSLRPAALDGVVPGTTPRGQDSAGLAPKAAAAAQDRRQLGSPLTAPLSRGRSARDTVCCRFLRRDRDKNRNPFACVVWAYGSEGTLHVRCPCARRATARCCESHGARWQQAERPHELMKHFNGILGLMKHFNWASGSRHASVHTRTASMRMTVFTRGRRVCCGVHVRS